MPSTIQVNYCRFKSVGASVPGPRNQDPKLPWRKLREFSFELSPLYLESRSNSGWCPVPMKRCVRSGRAWHLGGGRYVR